MADKSTNIKVKANYDLLSVEGNQDLWGVTFERKDDGYYAEIPKELADEMLENNRVTLVK